MRLGISSFTYTWGVGVPGHSPVHPLGALDLLGKAAALGVRVVQFADNLPLDRLTDPELDTLAQRSSELGICVEVGARGIDPDLLRTYLELAQRLGSPILRVVVDTADHHPTTDDVVRTIRGLAPAFERAGVTLAIENHDRFDTVTLVQIMQNIGSDCVGICLDTANSFGALEGPEIVVDRLCPWVANLHLKDFAIFRAIHSMGFVIEGRPVGQGRLDVSWLLQELQSSDKDPNAILELWTPWSGTLEATIGKEDTWAKMSVQYVRQFIEE
jgi:sugar phosphate isomerase/epimerase